MSIEVPLREGSRVGASPRRGARRLRTSSLTALAATAALTLAACGSSSGSGSGSGGGAGTTTNGGGSGQTTNAAASGGGGTSTSGGSGGGGTGGAASVPQTNSHFPTLSAPNKPASGSPLTFAMISLSSAQASYVENTQAAQAAARYVNAKLGGIGGHPIKIVTCTTDGTGATSSSCANKLIQQHPVAFFGDSDLATFASLPLINKAGLAYIGGVGFVGPEDILPNSFQFVGGSTMVWPAMGEYAVKNLHASKLAFTVPTGNPYAAIAAHLVAGAAQKAGLPMAQMKAVPLDPTAADVTSQVEAMNSASPDAMVGINTGTQCVSLTQAKQSLGVTAKWFLPSGCSDPKTIKAMGSAVDGAYMPFEVEVPGDNGPDVQLYKAVMAKYSPKSLMDEFTSAGFQEVMNTWTVLHTVKNITPKSVIAAFDKTHDVHNFMGPNFTCNHAVKAYPALCNPKQMMFQYDNGTWKAVSGFFDPTAYTNPKAQY